MSARYSKHVMTFLQLQATWQGRDKDDNDSCWSFIVVIILTFYDYSSCLFGNFKVVW